MRFPIVAQIPCPNCGGTLLGTVELDIDFAWVAFLIFRGERPVCGKNVHIGSKPQSYLCASCGESGAFKSEESQ